jgi:hypothetical protein
MFRLGKITCGIFIVFFLIGIVQSKASYITKKSDTTKEIEKIEKSYANGSITKLECTKKKSKVLKLKKVSKTICDNVEVKVVKKESKKEKKVEYIKKKKKKKTKAKKEFVKKAKNLSKKAKSWITKKVKKEKKHFKTIAQLPKSDFYFTATDDQGNIFIGYTKEDLDSKTMKIGNKKFKKISNGQAFQNDGKTQCSVRSEVDKTTNKNFYTGQVLVKCSNKIFIGIWHQAGNQGFGIAQSESGIKLDFTFSMSRNAAVASLNEMKKESKETKKIVKLEKKLFEVKKESKVDIAKLEKKLSESNLKIEDLKKNDSLIKLKKTNDSNDEENLKKINKNVENEPPLITFTYNRKDYESSADKNNPTIVRIEHADESYYFNGTVYDDGGLDKKQVTLLLEEDKKKAKEITIKEKGGNFSHESKSKKDKELWLVATDSDGKRSFILLQLKVKVASKSKYVNDKKYYALVIGNNDYNNKEWDDLRSPINDVTTVAAILKKKYKFSIPNKFILKNATRNEIEEAFDSMNEILTEEDYLLIYYAGHGGRGTNVKRAYWIPTDGKSKCCRNWINTSGVTDMIAEFKAKHVLLMVDSCFSGLLKGEDENLTDDGEKKNTVSLKKWMNRKTRLYISSGSNEPVLDEGEGKHSYFAKKFIELLETNNDHMTSWELFGKIDTYVQNNASQRPKYKIIKETGHNEGRFVFSVRN